MRLLPKWIITDRFPAIYDHESATAIEMVAKLYGHTEELVREYNQMVDDVNATITNFMKQSNSDYKAFTLEIAQKLQNFIDLVDLKVKEHDSTIRNAYNYMVTNLKESISLTMRELIDNGQFDELALAEFTKFNESIEFLSTYVTPQMYGAVGDGVTDDTEAFEQVFSQYEKPVFIPVGNYIIKNALTVKAQKIIGANIYNSCLIFSGLNAGEYAITLDSDFIHLDSFRITSDTEMIETGTTTTFNGVNSNTKLYVNIDRVEITNFNIGFNIGRNSWNNTYKDMIILNCNKGVYIAEEGNADYFYNTLIKSCTIGLHKIAGASVIYRDGDISYNNEGIVFEGKGDLSIDGTYFEFNLNGSVVAKWGLTPISRLSVENCSFTERSDRCNRVFYFQADKDSVIMIKNNYFRNVGEDPIRLYDEPTGALSVPLFIDNSIINFTVDDKTEIISNVVETGSMENLPSIKYAKCGVTGYIQSLSSFYEIELAGYTTMQLGVLPETFRPLNNICTTFNLRSATTGKMYDVLLRIGTDGIVTIENHNSAETMTNATQGGFCITYLIGN